MRQPDTSNVSSWGKSQTVVIRVLTLSGDEKIPSCESCTKDGIECVRTTNVRFRGFNKSGSEKYSFPEDQTWVQSAEECKCVTISSEADNSDGAVTYLDETTTVSRWYEDPDYLEADHDDTWTDARDRTGIDDPIRTHVLPNPETQDVVMTTGGSSLQKPLDEVADIRARPYAMLHAVTPVHESYSRTILSSTPRTDSSTVHGSPGSTSSRSYSTAYPLSVSSGPPNTTLTQREAVLMRNFTDNMALWVSVTDATTSPSRAL